MAEPLFTPERRAQTAGLLVALAAALLPVLGRGLYLDEVATPEAAHGRLALAVILLIALIAAPPGARRDPAMRWLLALLAVGLIAALIPRGLPGPMGEPLRLPADREAGVRELARLGLLLLAGAAALRVRPGWVLGGLFAGALWAAGGGLLQYLQQYRQGDTSFRVLNGFVSPNQFATYLLVVLPLCIAVVARSGEPSAFTRWLAARRVKRPERILPLLAGLGALLVLVALGLTGSRGAMLGLGAAGLVVAAALARRGTARALPLLGGLILVAALLLLGPMRQRLVEATAQSHSLLFRQLTWLGTLDMIAAMPVLGCGFGAWPYVYPLFAQSSFTLHAHNAWLQTAAEGGLPALVALIGLFTVWLRTGWRAAAEEDPSRRALGLALLAAAAGLAAISAFDSGWYTPAVGAAMVMLGASLAPPGGGVGRRWPVLLLGLLLAWVLHTEWRGELLRQTAGEMAQAARSSGGRDRDGALAAGSGMCEQAIARVPWAVASVEQQAALEAGRSIGSRGEELYRRAIALRPTSARLHYRRAGLLDERGRPDEAIAEAEASVRLSPLHLQGWLLWGRLLEADGQTARARQVYAKLDQLAQTPNLREAAPIQKSEYLFEPTQAYDLMRLAALADQAGDTAAARDAWTRALADFEQYERTYAQQEALVAELDRRERRQFLAMQGLYPDEREEVQGLIAEARERLGQ